MSEKILMTMFDLQNMMKKRLVEIEDLEERKEVRHIFEMVFSEMCAQNANQYRNLENTMDVAFKQEEKSVVIYSGLVDKHMYDKMSKNMYPLYAEDLWDVPIETDKLLDALGRNQPWKIGSFFLEADYDIVQQLAGQERAFYGIIRTKNMSYKATVKVEVEKKYREMVKKLFFTFLHNRIPWRTLCIPYFHKMFTYYITDTDLPWYEQIESVEIQFAEYEEWVRRDMIPVWNIEPVSIMSDVRPLSVKHEMQYHHVINGRRLQADSKYLLANTNMTIMNSYRDYGLHIFSSEPRERKWELYRIGTKVEVASDYEIFSNEIKYPWISPVRTVGSVIRLLNILGYEKRFSVETVGITNKCHNASLGYSMNEIWDETLVRLKDRPVLVIQLKSKVNDYLQTDILSYLISEVQYQYPEYHCVAKLV